MIEQTARAGLLRRPGSRGRDRVLGSSATGPIAVGLFGILFTGALSWIPSPWYDEAATISAATRTLPQLLAMLQNVDAVHGAYYVLMHAWFSVVGYSPLTLRLPSALAVGLTAAVLVVLARRLTSRRTAWVAGVVFCLLPRVTWMGTEGRSYALSALLATLLTLVFVGAWGWNRRDRAQRALAWIAYGVLAFLACTVFLYLALLVVAHGVTVVVARRLDGRRATTGVWGWALAASAAGVAAIPLAIDQMQQSRQVHWIPQVDAGTVRDVLVGQTFLGNATFAVVGWGLVLVGIALAAWRARGHDDGARMLSVALPWMIVPVGMLVTATVTLVPLYSPRYLTFTAPAVALLMAIGLTALPGRRLTAIALAACLGLSLPSYLHQRTPEAKQGSSWGQVAAIIADERALEPTGQTDAVIYGPLRKHPDADMAMLAIAYPAQFAGLVDVKAGTSAADRAQLWAGRVPLSGERARVSEHPVVWLVTSSKRDWRPGVTSQLALWGYRPDGAWSFTGVNLVKYVAE